MDDNRGVYDIRRRSSALGGCLGRWTAADLAVVTPPEIETRIEADFTRW